MTLSMAREQEIRNISQHERWPPLETRRVGIHTSIAGGVENAAERAYRLGCNTFQVFSTSPRQWQPYELSRPQCQRMRQLREQYDLKPLVIHSNYLINLASTTEQFLAKSIEAFRGELQRALDLCADYVVLHPGSFRGASREEGLARVAASIAVASRGLKLGESGLKVLIENTAGAEFSLGGGFEQLAEVIELLEGVVPVGACIDTCHVHVAGYDIVSAEGMRKTLAQLDTSVGLQKVHVWHCNDAKAGVGSKLDRHQHIGKGTIGLEPFGRLLNDSRLRNAAFIAETPIDEPGDDLRNVQTLRGLVAKTSHSDGRKLARKFPPINRRGRSK